MATSDATADLFAQCDSEGKGWLCLEDLGRACPQLSEEELAFIFDQLDLNKDARVSRDEFMAGFEKVVQAGEKSAGYRGLRRRASIQTRAIATPTPRIRETLYDSEPPSTADRFENLPW